MTHNPVLMRAVVEARVDELREAGAAAARRRGTPSRHPVTEGIRRRTGWLLVGMGLRLVMPGGAAHRSVARGQR